jgi:hypothetical protein
VLDCLKINLVGAEMMEFKNLPFDILTSVFNLLDPEDLTLLSTSGDKKFTQRLSREPLVSSVTVTNHLFPFSVLSTSSFSSLTRLVVHNEESMTGYVGGHQHGCGTHVSFLKPSSKLTSHSNTPSTSSSSLYLLVKTPIGY